MRAAGVITAKSCHGAFPCQIRFVGNPRFGKMEHSIEDLVFYTVHRRLKPIDTYTFIAARLLRVR